MKVEKSNWKRLQLKSLLKECSVKNRSLELSNVYSVTNSKGFVPASDYFDNTVQSNNLSTYKIVDKGMFAYNPSRINVGSIALLSAEDRVIVSPLYVIFSIVGNLNPNYLLRFLKSEIGLSLIRSKTSGSVRASLRFKDLASIELPVPSLSEQESIASELDALQEVIDGYREQIADLDDLAQSIFLNTFGDPISNPKGWEMKPIKELTIKMSTGPFGSMLHKEDYSADGIPSINPQDIKGNQISNANIARVNIVKAKELRKYVLDVNDVVIARRGDLCKCAVIREEQKGWLCGTGSFFLTLLDYNPTLFFYCYTSRSIQKYLNDKCIGATMPNLNQGILSSLKLPVPPIELQQRFANKIASIEQQKDLLRQQLADAEMLMAERMQYYFS